MDLTESIAPKSDQLNAEDMLAGPRDVTIVEVRKGPSAEQPVAVVLGEFGNDRPYLPCKSMRRVMVAGWGADASKYTGRRMTIYNDPSVKWGGMAVGGIRIQAMSHIDKPLNLALTVTRGKRAPFTVKPLADDAPPKPAADSIAADQLKAVGDGLTRLGITDRATMLATVSQVIDREIASSKDLTRAEASTVLDWIKFEETAAAEPTLPDGAA